MKRVIILGSKGMLGHMVYRYLARQDLDVIAFDERWTAANHDKLSEKIKKLKPDACINAIGAREGDHGGMEQLFWTNASLPGLIANALPADCLFIHASSDAVFASDHQECSWNAPHHPDTEYGRSKHLGESGLTRSNDWIIRCSIIGPEISSQKSLLSWYLHQSQPVKGFTNQRWNGITTLEWSRISFNIITGKTSGHEQIIQPGTQPPISKYVLLNRISRIWNHRTEIQPSTSDFPVHRSLIPNVESPPLEEQLIQLASFD